MSKLTWGEAQVIAMQFLQQSLDFETIQTNPNWEVVELYLEEVDADMFPKPLLNLLPTVFTVASADTFDTQGDEWLVNLVPHPTEHVFLIWGVRFNDGHFTPVFQILDSGKVKELSL